jgi:hypothetical protein
MFSKLSPLVFCLLLSTASLIETEDKYTVCKNKVVTSDVIAVYKTSRLKCVSHCASHGQCRAVRVCDDDVDKRGEVTCTVSTSALRDGLIFSRQLR